MISLEPFKKENYSELISWIDSQELLTQFSGPKFSFPLTQEQLEEDLKDKFAFLVKLNNEVIGHAQITVKPDSIYLGRLLLKSEFRDKGLGKLLVNELLRYGFSSFKRNKAELSVYDWNTAAIKCYEKVGFRVVQSNDRLQVKVGDEVWTTLQMSYTLS